MKQRDSNCVRFVLTAVLALTINTAVFAGQSCEERPLKAEVVSKAMELATKVQRVLGEQEVEFALIARVGQDLSKYNLKYSHVAFVMRVPGQTYTDQQGAERPVYRVKHELNACGTATSDVFDEGIGNFFMDDMFRFEAAVWVPSKAMQTQLSQMLQSTGRKLHHNQYNMLAYPFSTRYQNSNQWVLETIATSFMRNDSKAERMLYETNVNSQRQNIQAWLSQNGYTPTTLNLGPLTRLGARTRANVAFDDHPNARRFSDQIDVVTVDSVFRFLQKQDPQSKVWSF